MAVDLSLLKMHVDAFNKAKKSINEKKGLIVGTDVEAAFDTLKDHWRTGGFEPTEMAELVSIIKKNVKLFSTDRELQAELKSFASMCEIYYTKDNDTFDAFQATLQNKKPLDASIIQRIYEKEIGKLPESITFDEIHKKTNGNSLYELFSFEPDTFAFRILKPLVEDRNEFRKHPLNKKGKWEDFTLFANILKDENSKENYDAYYRFLRCKKILKGIFRRNKSVVSKAYIDTAGELEQYKICEDSKQAERLIVSFCAEIGLTCKPITAQAYAEQETRIEAIRKRIEESVNKLKEKQKDIESSLTNIGNEIDSLSSSIDSEINKMSAIIKNLTGSSETIYKEDDKIKELGKEVTELQKLNPKIKQVDSSRTDTKNIIAKEVKNADDKQEEITFDNVNEIYNYVDSQNAVIQKCFNEFLGNYNNEIKKNVQQSFNDSRSEFYNKEKEIKDEREKVKKRLADEKESLKESLNKNLKKYAKPITGRFIFFQIGLLITAVIILAKESNEKFQIIVYVNAFIFLLYIILVSRQFAKYNEAVENKMRITNDKIKYRSKTKLIVKIIWACIFFIIVQFVLLLSQNTGLNIEHLFSLLSSSSSPLGVYWSWIPAILFIFLLLTRKRSKNK